MDEADIEPLNCGIRCLNRKPIFNFTVDNSRGQPYNIYRYTAIQGGRLKPPVEFQEEDMTTQSLGIRVNRLVICGLFAALTVVCTMISIPLPFTPVPINLATLSVFMAGALLGPKYGAVSQAVYVLLGAAGLPVFSNFSGGLMKLVGPTGGYIASYIVTAFVVGLIAGGGFTANKGAASGGKAGKSKLMNLPRLAAAMAAGIAVCYALGTAWFMYSMNVGLAAALAPCVIPFIPGDIIKIIAGSFLCNAIRRANI